MEKTLFFVLGPALMLAALIVSAIGLRSEKFPSKGAMAATLVVFVALIGGVMVFTVLNAQSEPLGDENREASETQRAEGEEESVEEADDPLGAEAGSEASAPAVGKQTKLALSSPADGALSYSPSNLEAPAGTVTLDYENPSPVPHNIAIEDGGGEVLDQSQPGTKATFVASATLKPGEYVYFCSVPGHRESGMQGTLTVK